MSEEMEADLPFDKLERCMHEPARLAILSLLMNAEEGLSYRDLQDQLDLTYGNLERHMKVLIKAEVVEVRKVQASGRAQSFARFSTTGRDHFIRYLDNLEQILRAAQGRQQAQKENPSTAAGDFSADDILNLI